MHTYIRVSLGLNSQDQIIRHLLSSNVLIGDFPCSPLGLKRINDSFFVCILIHPYFDGKLSEVPAL